MRSFSLAHIQPIQWQAKSTYIIMILLFWKSDWGPRSNTFQCSEELGWRMGNTRVSNISVAKDSNARTTELCSLFLKGSAINCFRHLLLMFDHILFLDFLIGARIRRESQWLLSGGVGKVPSSGRNSIMCYKSCIHPRRRLEIKVRRLTLG